MTFRLTAKQDEAVELMGSGVRHILLRGGSRSGKTFVACRAIAVRAGLRPSTHVILRHRFNHLKASIILDTWPKMMRLCFPDVPWRLNKQDWYVELSNGSKVLFGGLDDKERTEKILGQEHSTIYLNEASQISYGARNKAITRLAQQSGLRLVEYIDCNPPSQAHWTYRLFKQKKDPLSLEELSEPDQYAEIQMNPRDNLENLSQEYLDILAALPEAERRRFLEGEWIPAVKGALWTTDVLDKGRIRKKDQLPDFRRICVAVDPSGCAGEEDERSDEIGITVSAVDRQGTGYVLEDLSGHYGPEDWAKAAVTAYDRWDADIIVGERNFGGAMVESTIRGYRKNVNVKLITASRGKTQRAEPVASLYTQGKVKHAGVFPELEDQLCNFSTAGYMGDRSPDRADSLIWGLTELMLGNVRKYGMLEVA